MGSVTIARTDWPNFCDRFTREHHGLLFNLAETDVSHVATDPDRAAEEGGSILAKPMPLKCVTVQNRGDDVDLSIVSDWPGGEICHVFHNPIEIGVEETTEGVARGLIIQTSAGQRVLMRFQSTATPEKAPQTSNGQTQPPSEESSRQAFPCVNL
jgi:hypothetical protein